MESFVILNNDNNINATPSSTHFHYNVQQDLINETLPQTYKRKSTQSKGNRKKQQERTNVQPRESTDKHKSSQMGGIVGLET